MTQNKVMKLWTAIVTAFIALCTALGFATTTATAAPAAPRTETPSTGTPQRTVPTIPAPRHWSWPRTKALPPTMKQRIGAEAHGKSPRCRHRPLIDTEGETTQEDPSSARLDC
ncbi:DUF6344 domain-containing protein [Streptomyces sp. NPDC052301]|uniref:DUF6344 domain-containing protein n=1 Tax=Streptomyces sp. NPDC052301 TaxID=3365687 RepID=UPI0037D52AEF